MEELYVQLNQVKNSSKGHQKSGGRAEQKHIS